MDENKKIEAEIKHLQYTIEINYGNAEFQKYLQKQIDEIRKNDELRKNEEERGRAMEKISITLTKEEWQSIYGYSLGANWFDCDMEDMPEMKKFEERLEEIDKEGK